MPMRLAWPTDSRLTVLLLDALERALLRRYAGFPPMRKDGFVTGAQAFEVRREVLYLPLGQIRKSRHTICSAFLDRVFHIAFVGWVRPETGTNSTLGTVAVATVAVVAQENLPSLNGIAVRVARNGAARSIDRDAGMSA